MARLVMLFKYCRNTCGEKMLWKYVLYCLNNKNCCSNNVIKHTLNFLNFTIAQQTTPLPPKSLLQQLFLFLSLTPMVILGSIEVQGSAMMMQNSLMHA